MTANQYQRSNSGSGSPPQPEAVPCPGGSKPHLDIKCPFPLWDPVWYENKSAACITTKFRDLSDWRDHMKRVHRNDYNCPSCKQRHQGREETLPAFVGKHTSCTLPPFLGFRPHIMTQEQSDADRNHSLRGKNNMSLDQKIRLTLDGLFPDNQIPLDKLWPGGAQMMQNPDILEAFGGFQRAGKYKNPAHHDSGYESIGDDKEPDEPGVEQSSTDPQMSLVTADMMHCTDHLRFSNNDNLPLFPDSWPNGRPPSELGPFDLDIEDQVS